MAQKIKRIPNYNGKGKGIADMSKAVKAGNTVIKVVNDGIMPVLGSVNKATGNKRR